ncbi:MAG: glycosyltransferase family 2 protein [Hyphomicrobiaceae bacterium]|nr:MAG: glycosyltransferase family 2 protein [Hyphomicrobiaceae bacterium]
MPPSCVSALVLLSTWNGAGFVREQVDSILSQTIEGGALHLLVRDDGSHDDTVAILEHMHDPRIEIVRGSNVGAKQSYLTLLAMARERRPDLTALADQDDVWLPGKLQRAADRLLPMTGPALYCSALALVDAHLRPVGAYGFPGTPSFEGAFLTNCVTGCTCVVNRAALTLLEEMPRPAEILMHDWWLYLAAAAFGTVIYDKEARILYRQHGANQVGRGLGLRAFADRGLKYLKRPSRPHRLTQAREFRRIHGASLSAQRLLYLDRLIACEGHPLKRARFALSALGHNVRGIDEAVGVASFLLGG